MSLFLSGLEHIIHPLNLVLLVGGSFIGTMVGAIPGLNSAVIIALVLPLTIALTPIQAFVGLTSLYCGSIYGGSISAILINVPGTPEACATTFDGYKLTEQGRPGRALGGAILASFLGGFTSVFFLIFLAPQLATVALVFGPAEYFSLGVLGVSAVIGLSPQSQLKGLFSGLLGLLIATVGTDIMTGYARFTFGVDALEPGISFIPMIIGLFAVSEILTKCKKIQVWSDPNVDMSIAAEFPHFSEMWALKWLLISCILLGVLVGIIPGTGATIAAFLAYAMAAQFSKNGHRFGTGVLDGVVAPESANNATTGGAMIPLLSLGIPGSGTTAVLLAALMFHGLDPGPILFVKHRDFIYTIFVAMLFANILILPIGWMSIRLFARVVAIKYRILGPLILLVCTAGSYAVTNHVIGVWTMFFFGVVGYLFITFNIPLSPMILGAILGKMVEENYLRTLFITGSVLGVFNRPIPAIILSVVIIILASYPTARWLARRKRQRLPGQPAAEAISDRGSGTNTHVHSVVFFCLSLLIWLLLLLDTYGFSKAKIYAGAAVWPSIILIGLIAMTAMIIIREIAALLKDKSPLPIVNETNFTRSRYYVAIGIFVSYAVILPIVGFPTATVLFVASLMVLLKETRAKVLVPVSIVSTSIVYIVFARFLAVWFPKGIGIFRTISAALF